MTERGEYFSDCCMAALQRMRAMSFSDGNSSECSLEEEDETLPLREFAPGFGWRSPYAGDYFFPTIGPRQHYDAWLPKQK